MSLKFLVQRAVLRITKGIQRKGMGTETGRVDAGLTVSRKTIKGE